MNCLKCGREISEDEVFCLECQLDAQRYPVNPATPVFLPKQKASEPQKKASRRRVLTTEEQLNVMHRRFRAALGVAIVSTGLALALIYPAVSYLKEEHYEKGQNYRSIIPAPTAAVTPPQATTATTPAE